MIIIFSSLYVDHLKEDKQEERNEGARQRKKGGQILGLLSVTFKVCDHIILISIAMFIPRGDALFGLMSYGDSILLSIPFI